MGANKKGFVKKYWFAAATLLITAIGFALRFICCYSGYPLQLHTDEPVIVEHVIDMLQRHSWEAYSFDRPDHFEIKCDAVIFTIVSWIRYHMPAYEAFKDHETAFYILARCFTAVFGTALIPLVGIFSMKLTGFLKENYKRIVGLLSMLVVAFSTIFVQHSAYASPDIVLTFFVVLFALLFLVYIDNGNKKALFCSMIIIGIGVTIKYPAAILCIPLAFMVIYRACFIDKKPKDILKYALIGIGLILFTIFVLAPNLITDIGTVYKNFVEEARSSHLGADGLGFFGNLKYYVTTIVSNIGTVTLIPFVIGLICIIFNRSRKWLSLSVGVIFWICMSVLALHWLRWGIPMYPFYIVVMSAGLGWGLQVVDKKFASRSRAHCVGKGVISASSIVLAVNIFVSGLVVTKYNLLSDTRLTSMAYFNENGIEKDDCIYEGYTSFELLYKAPPDAFILTEDGIKVNIEYATKKYYVMSNSFRNRYFAEMDRYQEKCATYNAIDAAYEKIYVDEPDGNYEISSHMLINIFNSVKYLLESQTTTGGVITAYALNPTIVTIQNSEGKYLSVQAEEAGIGLEPTDAAYSWVIYEDQTNVYTLLSEESGLAVDFDAGTSSQDSAGVLQAATGDDNQQISLVAADEADSYYIIYNGFALTYSDDGITLSEYAALPNQQWSILQI